jgi:hypothetical protein
VDYLEDGRGWRAKDSKRAGEILGKRRLGGHIRTPRHDLRKFPALSLPLLVNKESK